MCLNKNAQNMFVTFMEKWKKNEYRKIAKISPSKYESPKPVTQKTLC